MHFFNNLLIFFEKHCIFGFQALEPHAFQLIMLLGIIDICVTWTLYSGQLRMSEVISKVMKISFFMFFIMNFGEINHAILVSFQYAGLTAAGVPVSDSVIQPSSIIDLGFNACKTIFHELSVTKALIGGLGLIAMYVIYILVTLAAFFFMALQVLITKIEFNVFAALAVILLPFGALKYTQFLFQRVVSAVFAYGVKLMIMFFLLGLFTSVGSADMIPTWESGKLPDFAELMRYALEYATMAFLMWQLPNLAAGFMNGQPSMDAGGVIGGARQAAGTAATAGAAVASGGTATTTKVASTYGNAKATSYLAKNMPGSDTRTGYLKNFGKTMARQRFANSTIGKALMDGANHAMNQNEDYKNIRSGEAFRKPQKNRN